MKETKIEQRIENSINAFFINEESLSENSLTYGENVSLLRNESEVLFTEKADISTKVLKMAFIFLPGAFFLYFSSVFFLYAFFVSKLNLIDFGFGLGL